MCIHGRIFRTKWACVVRFGDGVKVLTTEWAQAGR
jgi:hypothetical protein